MKITTYTYKATLAFCIGLLMSIAYGDDNLPNKHTYSDDYWLNWQEEGITNIPTFDLKRSIEFPLGVQSQSRWYIDPETISIGNDSVVRYVVIAVSKSGALNSFYEGILCKDSIYKTYARAIGKKDQIDIEWRIQDKPEWMQLQDLDITSHQKFLARNIMCENLSTPPTTRSIIQRIRSPFQYTGEL